MGRLCSREAAAATGTAAASRSAPPMLPTAAGSRAGGGPMPSTHGSANRAPGTRTASRVPSATSRTSGASSDATVSVNTRRETTTSPGSCPTAGASARTLTSPSPATSCNRPWSARSSTQACAGCGERPGSRRDRPAAAAASGPVATVTSRVMRRRLAAGYDNLCRAPVARAGPADWTLAVMTGSC